MPDDQGQVAALLTSAPWERYYASELLEHFRAGS